MNGSKPPARARANRNTPEDTKTERPRALKQDPQLFESGTLLGSLDQTTDQ
jgi:hypothetical protein